MYSQEPDTIMPGKDLPWTEAHSYKGYSMSSLHTSRSEILVSVQKHVFYEKKKPKK